MYSSQLYLFLSLALDKNQNLKKDEKESLSNELRDLHKLFLDRKDNNSKNPLATGIDNQGFAYIDSFFKKSKYESIHKLLSLTKDNNQLSDFGIALKEKIKSVRKSILSNTFDGLSTNTYGGNKRKELLVLFKEIIVTHFDEGKLSYDDANSLFEGVNKWSKVRFKLNNTERDYNEIVKRFIDSDFPLEIKLKFLDRFDSIANRLDQQSAYELAEYAKVEGVGAEKFEKKLNELLATARQGLGGRIMEAARNAKKRLSTQSGSDSSKNSSGEKPPAGENSPVKPRSMLDRLRQSSLSPKRSSKKENVGKVNSRDLTGGFVPKVPFG